MGSKEGGLLKRAHVEGLRKSDPLTLSVLVQDLVRKPLVGLDLRTLSDLFALADEESLPPDLLRDLRKFREQMLREIADLPDGEKLQDWLKDLLSVAAARIHGTLRSGVLSRADDIALRPQTMELLEKVESHFSTEQADGVEIVAKAVRVVQRGPNILSPEEKKKRRAAGQTRRAPRVEKNPERSQWIRADLLERLDNYGDRGLKQAMLLAGAKHRSPWDDLSDTEIVAVLRDLEKAGKIKRTTNRWAIKGRW